jgi:hypothetical protein
MHVGDLDGVSTDSGNRWRATVTITVHDAGHGVLSNATVSGRWSRGNINSGSCVTNASGQCSVTSGLIPDARSSVNFSVTSVTRSGTVYQSSGNHDPDGDSNGTIITVQAP